MRTLTKYKILIYDTACMPLQARVDVDLFEDGGCQYLDYGHTGPLRGENTFGIELKLPAAPRSITVIVTDEGRRYSGNCYLNLNGNVSSRLDLTLWGLPSEGYGFGGGGFQGGPPDEPRGPGRYFAFPKGGQHSHILGRPDPRNAIGDIYERIQREPSWSSEQKKAVEMLVSNYLSFVVPNLANTQKHTLRFERVRDLWAETLLHLGISVSSIVKTKQKVAQFVTATPATQAKVF